MSPLLKEPEKRSALANARRREQNRERQRRHYERQEALFSEVDAFIDALIQAFAWAGCHPIFDHLPEERRARIAEVTRRLDGKKLVAFRRDEDAMQLSLLDREDCPAVGTEPTSTAPYQPHSATSREAAEALTPRLNELETRVLRFIAGQGSHGATDGECAEGTGLADTARPRRVRLRDLGLVEETERRRLSRRRRPMSVWVVTDAGREALEETA